MGADSQKHLLLCVKYAPWTDRAFVWCTVLLHTLKCYYYLGISHVFLFTYICEYFFKSELYLLGVAPWASWKLPLIKSIDNRESFRQHVMKTWSAVGDAGHGVMPQYVFYPVLEFCSWGLSECLSWWRLVSELTWTWDLCICRSSKKKGLPLNTAAGSSQEQCPKMT